MLVKNIAGVCRCRCRIIVFMHICIAMVIYSRIHSKTYLLNVSIETEEVEDAGAVHLGWMKATDHGHGAGGVASV